MSMGQDAIYEMYCNEAAELEKPRGNNMASKQGVVESFNPAGKKVGRGSIVYSFKLDDGEWYRTGFDKPELDEGDTVRFSFEDGQYGKEVDMKSLKVKKNPNGPPKKRSPAGQAGKDEYWQKKEERDIEIQKRIGYAGCVNSALALMANLVSADAFPVSKSKLAGKDGLAATQAVLVAIADEYWDLISNRPDELEKEKAATPVPNGQDDLEATKADAAEEDFDNWED